MRRVALTGGIGSGKSTVAAVLAELGALVIDADAIAREVVAPGTPGLEAVDAAFPGVVVDGVLDRSALAAIVFGDDTARRRLEEIVHPLIGAETARRMAAADGDAVVVYDIPLLVETGGAGDYDLVVAVEAPLEARLVRLEARGLPRDQAAERIAKQASDAERRAVADVVVTNDGDRNALAAAVVAAWPRISATESVSGVP